MNSWALWGVLAACAGVAFARDRIRSSRTSRVALVLLLVVAAIQGWLAIREMALRAAWAKLATSELHARAETIAEFMRDRGAVALAEIRSIASDSDTRALLSEEPALSQAARRPVFLDLLERFPRHGNGGATIYDLRGKPRAWAGWTPTASMSLPRAPSLDREILEIRQGNIFTILEATHPILGNDGRAVGFVVYHEPLRVEFPLHHRMLQIKDRLADLEGGAGVRADVALEVALDQGASSQALRVGTPKVEIRGDVAYATCALVGHDGAVSGRVSLSGLSRTGLVEESLIPWQRARAVALAVLSGFTFVVLWVSLGSRLWWARILVLLFARALALRVPWPSGIDLLGIFDPAWFASIRFGGLLRSPGDVVLTTGTVLLLGRELRRALRARRTSIVGWTTRLWPVFLPIGAVAALLVGSVVGLHWGRVLDLSRNTNFPLYGGLDPLTSAPAAALELGLLLLGVAFLVWCATLFRFALDCWSRFPRRLAFALLGALAVFASATKMGNSNSLRPGDFLLPLAALASAAAFEYFSMRRPRITLPAIFGVAALSQVANFFPLQQGFEARRRDLVELRALEHGESPSNSRQFLIETTLESLAASPELQRALADGPEIQNANLAFILWAKSPLASIPAGCHVRIFDAQDQPFSAFSLGFPPELQERPSPAALVSSAEVRFRREDVGSERVDLYTGRVSVGEGAGRKGSIELSLAYFDRLGQPRFNEDRFPSLFSTESSGEDAWRVLPDAPDRVDRYRGETLVASTDPEGGLGHRVPSVIVEALNAVEGGGRWVERRIGGNLYDLFCLREHDGRQTVGYLTFGIQRHGLRQLGSLFARSLLVSLVLAAGALFLARVVPGFHKILDTPLPTTRIGFREQVIGGFFFVSLLPTVFLGVAGRGLFVLEKRRQFQSRLEEDLRVSRESIAQSLSDVAANAATSAEVKDLLVPQEVDRALSAPSSVDGLMLVLTSGAIRASSPGVGEGLIDVARQVPISSAPTTFFRKLGNDLVACAMVEIPPERRPGAESPGVIFAFQRVDAVLASELERRVGSAVSFFADGVLNATSKPELYQSEILSDLVEALAFQKVELENARRAVLESRFGKSAFLANYAPLLDERGQPVGLLATLAPFHGGGLDADAALVLSRIYYLCLLVFAAALCAALFLADRLTRPILDLTQGARRIGAGELGHRIFTRAGGEIRGLVQSFNLMSEKLAESEVRDRERREFIEAIIRHVGSGVISLDASGHVATVNEAASRILGATPAEIEGRRAFDAGLAENASRVLETAESLLAGQEQEVVREVEIFPEAGEPRTLRLVGTPLRDRRGDPEGAVLVFEDLTDLIRSKKITAWAEMARQVAHEIKNPLTPMKLSAQHVQQAWKDKHPKFEKILQESTDTIIDRCEALRRIAIEFSDYARMPGRRIRTEDLGGLIEGARRLYGDTEDRNVRIRVEAPPGELFTRVDKDEVMRLLINLIENSIQAMPRGGDLSIQAWGENGSALVSVQDSGVGIPPQNLQRIFEPSFSTKTGGAGLGLPICRAIMEDYGGSIQIESEGGRGTTVRLRFPTAPAPTGGTEEEQSLDPGPPRP